MCCVSGEGGGGGGGALLRVEGCRQVSQRASSSLIRCSTYCAQVDKTLKFLNIISMTEDILLQAFFVFTLLFFNSLF
jgi:hypothetical protein